MAVNFEIAGPVRAAEPVRAESDIYARDRGPGVRPFIGGGQRATAVETGRSFRQIVLIITRVRSVQAAARECAAQPRRQRLAVDAGAQRQPAGDALSLQVRGRALAARGSVSLVSRALFSVPFIVLLLRRPDTEIPVTESRSSHFDG